VIIFLFSEQKKGKKFAHLQAKNEEKIDLAGRIVIKSQKTRV
jgi:hypothetical protein